MDQGRMITEFSIYEVVRWYKGGKLGSPEKDNVPVYKDWLPDDEFRNFLIDNDCYDKYLKNVEKLRPGFINDINRTEKSQWLNYCFTWSETPERYKYWSRLNSKWQEKW